MALKLELETLDGVAPEVAKEYKKETKDGKVSFILDVTGYEDTAALKRAKDHEKEARKGAEAKVKELSTNAEKLQEELDEIRRGAIPKGDVERLEGSWKEKLAKKETELQGQIDTANKSLQRLLVENVATSMASSISTSPELILPHIRARLTTDFADGEFKTKVLDKDGKPSAASIEELQKEFTENKAFAAILIGSRASGSGANGGGSGGSSASGKGNLAKASAKDLVAHIQAQKSTGG